MVRKIGAFFHDGACDGKHDSKANYAALYDALRCRWRNESVSSLIEEHLPKGGKVERKMFEKAVADAARSLNIPISSSEKLLNKPLNKWHSILGEWARNYWLERQSCVERYANLYDDLTKWFVNTAVCTLFEKHLTAEESETELKEVKRLLIRATMGTSQMPDDLLKHNTHTWPTKVHTEFMAHMRKLCW